MLRSLVLLALFFGLISMILPEDRKGEWVRLLLIVVMFLSVGANFAFDLSADLDFLSSDFTAVTGEAEREVLHNAVGSCVFSLTGELPLLVESDLSVEGEELRLTEIRVVIRRGDREEVLNELERTFSFEGFLVLCEEDSRSGEVVPLFP